MATTDAARLALYQQAEEEILLGGQSTAINGRTLTEADLGKIQAYIEKLQARVDRAARGPIRLGRPPDR